MKIMCEFGNLRRVSEMHVVTRNLRKGDELKERGFSDSSRSFETSRTGTRPPNDGRPQSARATRSRPKTARSPASNTST